MLTFTNWILENASSPRNPPAGARAKRKEDGIWYVADGRGGWTVDTNQKPTPPRSASDTPAEAPAEAPTNSARSTSSEETGTNPTSETNDAPKKRKKRGFFAGMEAGVRGYKSAAKITQELEQMYGPGAEDRRVDVPLVGPRADFVQQHGTDPGGGDIPTMGADFDAARVSARRRGGDKSSDASGRGGIKSNTDRADELVKWQNPKLVNPFSKKKTRAAGLGRREALGQMVGAWLQRTAEGPKHFTTPSGGRGVRY
jgi:hypothetical protein